MKTLLLLGALALSLNSFAQETYVPDDNFEAYLEANAMGNGIPNDDYVTTANISGVTSLLLINIGLNDVTGLEDFNSLTNLNIQLNPITTLTITNTNLTDLYCLNNSLSTLDVTSATAIEFIDCSQNQLTNLDFISNINLDWLRCDDNNLTSLDVSQNTALTNLYCFGNLLTSLDVSGATALTNLFCYNNQLTSLDVSQNTLLTTLHCQVNQLTCLNVNNGNNTTLTSFNATLNPHLLCIEVDNVGWSNNFWTDIDAQTYFSTDCDNSCATCNNPNPITSQPTDQSETVGNDAVFLFTDALTGATYQWQMDAGTGYTNISNAGQFSGTTTQTVTVSALTMGNNNSLFRCLVSESANCQDTTDFATLAVIDNVGLEELSNTPKQLLKIVDLMGRETPYKPNTVLIYVFDDGSTEKVFKMD